MKQLLLAAGALVMVASPTFAQTYGPDPNAPYSRQNPPVYSNHATADHRRAARQRTPYEAFGQSPNGGYRWPGARYDENGYYIDPNSPGRW